MTLSEEQVLKIIDTGAPEFIKSARKAAKDNNMHITGHKAADYLKLIEGYENFAQKKLREKLMIRNKSLFSYLLRPTDKIFTAKGGNIAYNLPENDINKVKNRISAITNGLDIKSYLKKVVKKHCLIDPNAVLMVDITENSEVEINIHSIHNILWYKLKGNKVEAIVFEAYEVEEEMPDQTGTEYSEQPHSTYPKKYKYYRVIDASSDRVYKEDEGKITLETSYKNPFGEVPATVVGDVRDYNQNIFVSIIDDVKDDALQYMNDISIKTVHKLSHGFPKYWEYEQSCIRCYGDGEVDDGTGTMVTCPSCSGHGVKVKHNASDISVIPMPQEGEPVLKAFAGYTTPSIEIMRFYEDQKKEDRRGMFQTLWGTTYQESGKRETATGRFIDVQPVQDRLRDISDNFARMHKFLLDFAVRAILKKKGYESIVTYGKRYILESPDEILDKYREVCSQDVSEGVKMDLLVRYYDSEYQDDNLQLMIKKKFAKVEPFPNQKASYIAGLEFISIEERAAKLYFPEWYNSLEEGQKILLSEKELKQSLAEFVKNKLPQQDV